MSFAKNILNEEDRGKKLWTNAWLLFLIVVATAALAGIINNALRQDANRIVQTELQLVRLLQHSYALNAYEWQVIAEGQLPQRVRNEVAKIHRDLETTLESLIELELSSEEVQQIAASYSYYIKAVEDEFDLLAQGHVEEARVLDRTLVAPAFLQFEQTLENTNTQFRVHAQIMMKRIAYGSVLTLLLAILVIGVLIWKIADFQHVSEIAMAEKEVLQRANMLLEIEIEARKDLERELVKTKEEAESATKAKSEFLAMMGHEIRTPMNGMLGFTSLLQNTSLTPDQRGFVSRIQASGSTLLALLNDLLDLSKVEAGKIDIESHTFSLQSCIEEAMDRVAVPAADKGLRLSHTIDEDVPHLIIGDPVRTGQVLGNLLSNAVKFTSQGGVSVNVSCEEIPEDGIGPYRLRFSVADTGIGIPPDRLSSVFESFTQADNSTTRRYGGSGLGLAICKRLCGLMGGSIYVESKPGIGSTFYFTIQISAVPDEKAEPARPEKETAVFDEDFASQHPLRILVAEDNKMNQELVQLFFSNLGYESTIVSNGQEAIEALASADYDVIFMDIYMPELDGISATRIIRERHGHKHRIIAMTASVTENDRSKCRAAGMDGFISKPLQVRKLERILQKTSASINHETLVQNVLRD